MLKRLREWTFAAFLILLIFGVGIGIGAYLHYQSEHSAYEAVLQEENAKLQQEKQLLGQMVERLGRSIRLAQIVVTEQTVDETTLLFVELNDAGETISRDCVTIPGQVAYFDGLVVKFKHDSVAQGHPLRGQSVALLRRIYSERQSPRDGYLLDQTGDVPPGYQMVGNSAFESQTTSTLIAENQSDLARFEQRIWSQFWNIANDPALAEELGVRVAQGEAVYKPMQPGVLYELTLDAAGGMNLETRPLPEAVADVLAAVVDVNEILEGNN